MVKANFVTLAMAHSILLEVLGKENSIDFYSENFTQLCLKCGWSVEEYDIALMQKIEKDFLKEFLNEN